MAILLALFLVHPAGAIAPKSEYPGGLIVYQNCLLAISNPVYLGEYVKIVAPVTAYTKIETCPREKCITASGKAADYDIIACPRELPLGTLVEIGETIYECGDRTHPRYDGRFDLWFGTDYRGAIKWGKQLLTIKIYKH